MDYNIEKAKLEDLDAICKIIRNRCLWFSKNGVKGWNVNSYPYKYDRNYFMEQMNINGLFVAKSENKVCGLMLLKDEDKRYWDNDDFAYYIHHLTTDVNLKGVGRVLLDFAKYQCRKNNKKYLRLDCYQDSIFLNSYYEKVGFTNVGSGKIGTYSYNLWEMKI